MRTEADGFVRRTENRVSERLATSTDRAQIILVPDNSTSSSPIQQPVVSAESSVWKVAYDADKELQKQIFDADGNFLHAHSIMFVQYNGHTIVHTQQFTPF